MTNTTQTVFTTLSALKAMSEIAPAKEIRYYLNGVYFECNKESTRLVATDGHCLGVYEASQENILDSAINFIMPLDVIKLLKVVHKQCEDVTITIERKHETQLDLITDGTIQVAGGPAISWKAVDGRFPDYIRVIPKETMSGETAQFDPAIVNKFVRVAKCLGLSTKNGVPIGHNGGGSALIALGDPNFIGVIMPMRVEPVTSTPARFLTRLI